MSDWHRPRQQKRDLSPTTPPPRRSKCVTPRAFVWAAGIGLLLVLFNVVSSVIDSPLAYATFVPSSVQLKGAHSKPNTVSPTIGSKSLTHSYKPGAMGNQKNNQPQTINHGFQMSMKPASFALQTNQAAHFLSSDGRLEVQVPAGAVSVWNLAQAGGTITLHVTQIAPASGSTAGGSGLLSLGTYLIQLQDAQGALLTYGLLKPITVKYHLKKNELSLGLDHAYLLLNGSLPAGVAKIKGTLQPAAGTTLESTVGALQHQSTALDPKAQTLTVTPQISTPSTSLSWNSDAPIASFGKPDPFSTDLSVGGLTASEPITIPAGPGSLTPPVKLVYNSESVNEQHSYLSAAGWVGEGWNLSFGEITWNQHNVTAGTCTPQPSCGNWQNQWYLNDPYGTSSELIPPNVTASTYYDATSNNACQMTSPSVPCPMLWHTANESHAKIYAYIGPNSIPSETIKPVCWRVWLSNGIMEEFGCTSDSLQYFYVSGGHAEVNGWFLDMITDPQGNQIHVTYQRDMENWTDTSTNTTYSYPRDVVPSTVTYDSSGCLNAQTMCTGSSWAPLMQVVFNASHSPSILTGSAPNGCNTGTNLRCDDPAGSIIPIVQNTYVLNSIQVQVRTTGTGTWNTLSTYNLGYEQSGPSSITDPASGLAVSAAGLLDLTRFQQVGSISATALMYSGKATSSTSGDHAYLKVFDVSSKNIVVGANTTLSYWIYPQSSARANVSGSNSTCVAIDMVFTDGTSLRDSGAVDQNGNQVHPAHQCNHLTMDQWNLVTSNIGAKVSGKTINRIDIGYDQPDVTGGYRGYIDDIALTNPTSSTPLFATDLESGSPQPTWTSTVDTTAPGGNLLNIGGFSGSLTAPELGTRQEGFAHADTAILPQVQFSYTTLTNYYEDTFFKPNSSSCGPSWNTGTGSGCVLWEQSYANADRYLSTASNGQGLSQSFSWQLARNNSHGVPGGGSNNADPFYCDSHQTTSPCQVADDSGWSHVVLASESSTTVRLSQSGQGGTQTSTPITSTTNYSYQLTYPLTAQECSDCVAGMYWGDQNNGNYLNYYNSTFMGFAQTTVNEPSGGVDVHKFYAGEGWGIYDTNTNEVKCATPSPCHKDPWWDLANAAHGHEYQTLSYDADGTTLLQEVDTSYQAICPPAGVSGTPHQGTITWDGMLISDVDHNNPIAVCDIQQTQQVSKTFDGSSNNVTTTTNWTYDSYGRTTQASITTNGGTPTKVVKNTVYVWNDNVTATQTSATGTYILDTVAFADTEDGSGNRLACSYASYDGQSYTTGQTSALTGGLATSDTSYSNCGTSANGYTPSGPSTTTKIYNTYGSVVGTIDADANAGITGHTGCTINSTQYTTCLAYDNTFSAFPISSSNALNQTSSNSYANTGALFGYGTWPISTTDVNNQTINYTYDSLRRVSGAVLPGETSGKLTKQWVYTNWCNGSAAQIPCEELDEIDRINSSTTLTKRGFYDGEGRLVETRSPGPNGQDTITYAYYDVAGRQVFKSNPYFVTAYTGTPGAAAYSIPDSTQPGVSYNYYSKTPNLRTTSVTDSNSHTTTMTESVVCGVASTSDSGCYVQLMSVDADGHEKAMLTGGLGETNYQQVYTGNNTSTYALNSTTIYTYDASGDWISTQSPDGTIATVTFDALGRETGQVNPDSGSASYAYDPNGNMIESIDARGSAGTVYYGYDGLDRELWRNNTNSSSGAWLTYTYDNTANGNFGVGQMTGENFTGSGGLSGSYVLTYDARGQQVGQVTSVNGTSYPIQSTYDDNGQMLSVTYPTGEVVTAGYSSTGWLSGLTTKLGTTVTTLASNLTYTGLAGAAGKITSMNLGSGDTYAASYDTGMRPTSVSLTRTSDNTLIYQTQPSYDAVNNVVSVQTSLSGQTDTQQFCYDDLYRITWAGTSGTPPCSGVNFSAGTLAAAQYQQSDNFNIDGGLTSGPSGSYTYSDSNHPHAVTSTSNGYSASYDASGNLVCRALTSATTCSGASPTGQQLTYDAQGRLSGWQDQPSSPTQTVNYLYDGSGQRLATQTTVSGTTTLTTYINDIEEVQTTGGSSQTTTYYYVEGQRVAAAVNGTFYYFGNDALGSPVVALNTQGNVIASQLYGPYGVSRYNTGALPISIGFTGQHTDSVTGLDYYNARYYDPVVGVFLAPDWIQGNILGMDPYTYVLGNPETLTDPTGLECSPDNVSACVQQGLEFLQQQEPSVRIVAPVIVPPLITWIMAAVPYLIEFAIALAIATVIAAIIQILWKPTLLGDGTLPLEGGSGQHSQLRPPTQGDQNYARGVISQLRRDRGRGKGGRSELSLSNGHTFTYDSYKKSDRNTVRLSDDYGKEFKSKDIPRSAFCAEARCMQAAEDAYGNNPPTGLNEAWETQKDGKRPCDWTNGPNGDEGGCTPGYGNFSRKFGPTRVWWEDKDGNLHSQDFVGGEPGPVVDYEG